MSLTAAQLQTLKADIENDPVLSAIPSTPDGAFAIADIYNADATPGYVVWRTSVNADEIMGNGFVWTAVDGLTNGKARIWEWMTRFGSINPSKANIRQGLNDAFGVGSAMANAIAPHLKRNASRIEKLFASGGSGTSGSPATMAYEGPISAQEIDLARSV